MSSELPVPAPNSLTPEEHLTQTWARFLTASREQLRQLQKLSLSTFLQKNTDESVRAIELARQLADGCEAFRLPEAVRLARQVQGKLAQGSASGSLAQLLVRLDHALERGPTDSPTSQLKRPLLWLYSGESELQDRFTAAATFRGYQVRSLRYTEALAPPTMMDFLQPEVLVLVIMEPDDLRSLRALRLRFPKVPMAVISGQESFALRMEAARASVAAVLLRDEPLEPLFDLLSHKATLPLPSAAEPLPKWATSGPAGRRGKVLALGDEHSVGPWIQETLKAAFEVNTLDDMTRLIDTLERLNPDLVILDFTPEVRGLEICRILRTHPRWASLSIILVTASQESRTAELIVASGADDFLAKPLRGPELTARVTNRLQRSLARRIQGDLDRFTGLPGQHEAVRSFVFTSRIAERHNVPLSFALIQLQPRGPIDLGIRELAQMVRQDMRRLTDQVARWDHDVLAVALYDTSRVDCHQLLQRLFQRAQPLGQLRASLATFPADGAEALHLLQDLEFVLSATPYGGSRSLGSHSDLSDQVVWLRDMGADLADWDDFFSKRGRSIQWLTEEGAAQEKLFSSGPELVPQVLCLDLSVSFINGFEVLRKLASSSTRVIVLCNDDFKQVFRAQEAGAFDVLTKPVDLSLMALRIERALGD